MRKIVCALVAATCLSGVCPMSAQAMDCVDYVRSVTGFDLSGEAYQWWHSTADVYARGHHPEVGAVIVFSRTQSMSKGHVAVVRAIRNSREILVDQANAAHDPHGGEISIATSIVDVSTHNDWTEVRVARRGAHVFSRINPVDGFIYSDGDALGALVSARFIATRSASTGVGKSKPD